MAPGTLLITGDWMTCVVPSARLTVTGTPFRRGTFSWKSGAATATPVTQANIIIDAVNITPFPLNCNETASINVTIRNAGTGASNSGGAIFVQDVHINSGQQQQSTVGTFPVLNPGQTFVSQMRLTVSTFHREQHRININVDSNNQVAETNEGDNTVLRDYTLRRGDCG